MPHRLRLLAPPGRRRTRGRRLVFSRRLEHRHDHGQLRGHRWRGQTIDFLSSVKRPRLSGCLNTRSRDRAAAETERDFAAERGNPESVKHSALAAAFCETRTDHEGDGLSSMGGGACPPWDNDFHAPIRREIEAHEGARQQSRRDHDRARRHGSSVAACRKPWPRAASVDVKEVTPETMSEFKVAVSKVLTPHASAILLDRSSVWEAAKRALENAGLLLAYELSGYDNTQAGRCPICCRMFPPNALWTWGGCCQDS